MLLPTSTHLAGSIAFRASDKEHPIACDVDDLRWHVFEPGPAHGAILVERLRTFGTKVIDLDTNAKRLWKGSQAFGFDPQQVNDAFVDLVEHLTTTNLALIRSKGDVSIIVVYAPTVEGGWSSLAHLAPIPYRKLHEWYAQGVRLYTSTIQVPTNDHFPNSFKHRSRLAYWMADRTVQSRDKNGVALLETTDGFCGDTSVANILLVSETGEWTTPSTRSAIEGTTLQRVCRLLGQQGIHVQFRDFTKQELLVASEVVLVGTTGCIWNASHLDDECLAVDRKRTKTRWLQSLWQEWTGIDVIQQAADRAHIIDKP